MGTILGLVLTVVIMGIGGAIIITIVGKLGLGLEVDDFGSAFIAAIVIAIVSALVHWVTGFLGLTGVGNWLAVIVNLIVAAVILMISDKFVKGMRVAGFFGALVAAFAIAVVSGIAQWLVSLI